MHLTICQIRSDVPAIVHAHPPFATGFAVAGSALDLGLLPEVVLNLGWVPLAEYGLPGTPALSKSMLPFIGKYDALLLANRGAVAYCEDLSQACFRLDTIEHFAHITLVAKLFGGPKLLPRVEIEKLYEARARYGLKSRNCFEPGLPLPADDIHERSDLRPGLLSPRTAEVV